MQFVIEVQDGIVKRGVVNHGDSVDARDIRLCGQIFSDLAEKLVKNATLEQCDLRHYLLNSPEVKLIPLNS